MIKTLTKLKIFILLILLVQIAEAREYKIPVDIEDTINELGQNFTRLSLGCSIDIHEDLINPQPLLIKPNTNSFYDPNPKGIIHISSGKSIELQCVHQFAKPFQNAKKITPKCLGGKFIVQGKEYEFNDFVCKSWSSNIARRTGRKCNKGLATEIEVGFQLTNRFIRLFDLCHDEDSESTLYVHHFLIPASSSNQHNIGRTNFKQGDFYNRNDVNTLYTQVKQKETIGDILDGNHEKYFNEKKALFLARGHLSAKADHIFGNQQRATFYFVNAAPQWQVFNAGNWQTIEDEVRTYVGRKKMYVECYTGTWGVGTLADANNKHQELYLYFDENNNGRIPVPKIYYRIVIEPSTKRGIVFIGVNNPHLTMDEIRNDYIICDDISDMITWINWKKNDIRLGYSYACEVNEFAEVVGHLPKLDVEEILH